MDIPKGNTTINLPIYVGVHGLTLSAVCTKNGAATGNMLGTISEPGGGWYSIAANSTDANTLGGLGVTLSDGTHIGYGLFSVTQNSVYSANVIFNTWDVTGSVNISGGLNISNGMAVDSLNIANGEVNLDNFDAQDIYVPAVRFDDFSLGALECDKIDFILGLVGHNAGVRNFIGPSNAPTSFDICYYDTNTHASLNDGITGLVHHWTCSSTRDGSGNIILQKTPQVS